MTGDKTGSTTDAVEIMHRLFFDGDPEAAEALKQERIHAEVAQAVYDLRTQNGLSQKELAGLIGTQASAISRLEDANYEGHSLNMLERVAAALGKRVKVSFEDRPGYGEFPRLEVSPAAEGSAETHASAVEARL